jgi:CRISPR-associated protein Csd1
MLRHLVEYARKECLVTEPGFAPKSARWAICFTEDGRFLNVVEIGDVESKRNTGLGFGCAPDLSQSELVSGPADEKRCHFLIESADVVALYVRDDPDERVLMKHDFFLRMLREASEAVPQLATAVEALADEECLARIREQLAEQGARYTDKVTLRCDDCFPVEDSTWHSWWREFRASLTPESAEDAPLFRDLITGELIVPAATHPKISGLTGVGGQSAGSALVSFDKDAFTSYGLDQSANCAIAEANATAYCSALNHLLQHHSRRLGNMMLVHWFKERVPDEDNPLPFVIGTDEEHELNAQERARKLLEAIHSGERPDLGQNYFYALTMSGTGGRVMIRDWMEGRFETLLRNVLTWFEDLEIVHRQGGGNAPPPKFMAVIGATVRELGDAPAPFINTMLRSALHGGPIPRTAMAKALQRVRVDIIGDETPNHARMGLLRAFHVRNSRLKGDEAMSEATRPHLNPEHPSPAYHCGRLMAILAGLQRSALGDVGAGVVQRYYAAASTTPSLVLGRLTRNSQFHLNKLDGGLAHWYEGRIGEVYSRLGDDIPKTLTPEGQSLFALGYYQQLVDLRTSKKISADPEGESISE